MSYRTATQVVNLEGYARYVKNSLDHALQRGDVLSDENEKLKEEILKLKKDNKGPHGGAARGRNARITVKHEDTSEAQAIFDSMKNEGEEEVGAQIQNDSEDGPFISDDDDYESSDEDMGLRG